MGEIAADGRFPAGEALSLFVASSCGISSLGFPAGVAIFRSFLGFFA